MASEILHHKGYLFRKAGRSGSIGSGERNDILRTKKKSIIEIISGIGIKRLHPLIKKRNKIFIFFWTPVFKELILINRIKSGDRPFLPRRGKFRFLGTAGAGEPHNQDNQKEGREGYSPKIQLRDLFPQCYLS